MSLDTENQKSDLNGFKYNSSIVDEQSLDGKNNSNKDSPKEAILLHSRERNIESSEL
jgi:hypothetical protein